MSNQKLVLKEYITQSKEVLLYTGNPNLEMLEGLVNTPGDVWHSSVEQGLKNCFQDIKYQTAVYWWFLNDLDKDVCVNWRINLNAFVVKKQVWNLFKDAIFNYENIMLSGLDFGFNLLRYQGGIPLYVKGLFADEKKAYLKVTSKDRYYFYLKNFKKHHSYYMLLRKGVFKIFSEHRALKAATAKLNRTKKGVRSIVPLKDLEPLNSKPTVSLVIPTMKRQEFTELLLQDHNAQTYLIKEAIIVDATPEEERGSKYYQKENFKFDIKVKWQTSKGSCRARNEAIEMCIGDYIIFADDDIRILPDFVENHLRFLQTYNAQAANGLDIMATNQSQDLRDLKQRLENLGEERWKGGVSQAFSNANSIVKRSLVKELIGNDVNFDGGYGEDSDFGLRILKSGNVVLYNPFSPNLHLKPPQGGYRFWGRQSKIIGKKRKTQPWELDNPVKFIKPVPSPTITYGILKHYNKAQIKEWRSKYFFIYLFKKDKKTLLFRLLKLPYRQYQFSKSLKYAKRLMDLGPRYK
ncbi:hypothetical protein MHTCC0001_05550 [Flavobacteriaceae bacterium MHTCC 0001]